MRVWWRVCDDGKNPRAPPQTLRIQTQGKQKVSESNFLLLEKQEMNITKENHYYYLVSGVAHG